jgi:hypothetical protein
MGYTDTELDGIQARWTIRFPPDLRALLKERRSLLDHPRQSFDWLQSDPALIKNRLDLPFESFLYDVENNNGWWPEWGATPETAPARRERLAEIFADTPRLIPIYAHRYIPEVPNESGNPIFSSLSDGRDLLWN